MFAITEPMPMECRNYKWLNEADRAVSQINSPVLCDSNPLKPAWYRFGPLAGTNMLTSCVPKNKCGTHACGWLHGRLPTKRYQVVPSKFCFHWFSNICAWSRNIRVRNCGSFNVFHLTKPPACSLRYCGNKRKTFLLS